MSDAEDRLRAAGNYSKKLLTRVGHRMLAHPNIAQSSNDRSSSCLSSRHAVTHTRQNVSPPATNTSRRDACSVDACTLLLVVRARFDRVPNQNIRVEEVYSKKMLMMRSWRTIRPASDAIGTSTTSRPVPPWAKPFTRGEFLCVGAQRSASIVTPRNPLNILYQEGLPMILVTTR